MLVPGWEALGCDHQSVLLWWWTHSPNHPMLIFWCWLPGRLPCPNSSLGLGALCCSKDKRAAVLCGWDIPARSKPDRVCRALLNQQLSHSIKSTGINLPFEKHEQSVVKANEAEIALVKRWGSPWLITLIAADTGWSWSAFWLNASICGQIPISPNCAVLLCLFAVILGYASKICAVSIFIWVSTPVALPPLYSFAVKPAVEKHSWFSSLNICLLYPSSITELEAFQVVCCRLKTTKKSYHFCCRKYELAIV